MKKEDLLSLDADKHLSVTELRKKQSSVVPDLDARLEERLQDHVKSRVAGGSDKLRALLEATKVPLKEGDKADARKVHEAAIAALKEAAQGDEKLAGDAELAKELEELEKSVAESDDRSLADTLQLDQPIAFHPAFRAELDAARIYRLSDATGLGDRTAKTLIDSFGSVGDIDDARLDELVANKKLSNKKATEAGVAASLFNVVDERFELFEAVGASKDPRELVTNRREDWVKLIEDSKVSPPGALSAEDYAAILEKKVERLFPTDALMRRFESVDVRGALGASSALDRLRKLNPGVSVTAVSDFEELDTGRISAAKVKELRADFDEATKLVNKYAGMKLGDLLEDESLTKTARNREVNRRTELVDRFFGTNTDVLGIDLTPGSAEIASLSFGSGSSAEDKAMVLATARAYQRALTVTDDLNDADALVAGGFHSAMTVARSSPDKISAATGISAAAAAGYYTAAEGIATAVAAHAGTIIDILEGTFGTIGVGNISPTLEGFLKEIPGFADLFGSQNYCDCEHCDSILGPAAYFVDLMCFVEENVTQEHFTGLPDHRLRLENRRPDLWALELTCENTNTPIPYLVVINEILENAVARDVDPGIDVSDRDAVESAVYRDTLPQKVDSFGQPLNLPFEEVGVYLGHFRKKLANLAEAGNAGGNALARLRLGLSPEDFALITSQSNTGLPFLRRVYGIQFTQSGSVVEKFDAQELLDPMGVSRQELGELTGTAFVTFGGSVAISIDGEKLTPDSIQNDVEMISGLTRSTLDRMHRFVRLWRETGWRIGELDLVLTHLARAGVGPALDEATVHAVALLHRLQTTNKISVEELVALWSTTPREPVLAAAPKASAAPGAEATAHPRPLPASARLTVALFDRLFNRHSFVAADGSYPKPATDFLHPALAAAPPANVDPNHTRLVAALGTTEDGLYQLIVGLARPLGIDPASATDSEKSFALTERHLSLLYRHVRLAKLLRCSIPELFALVAMVPGIENRHVEALADVEAIIEFHRWLRTTDWTITELAQIVQPAHPAIITSLAPVAGSAAGEQVAYTTVVAGSPPSAETMTLGANADLDSVVADWMSQATTTIAYRSDSIGVSRSDGDHLSVRSIGTGPSASIRLTNDSAGTLAAAVPHQVDGRALATALGAAPATDPAAQAETLVSEVHAAESLIFADTVFASMPPIAPVATSSTPVPSTAGTETLTFTAMLDGQPRPTETVALGVNADLDAIVTDWNAQASSVRAYRSDAAGVPDDTGAHLSLTVSDAAGSNTQITITADSAGIFPGPLPAAFIGAEITEDQSRAVIQANLALLEDVDGDGRYRLAAGFDPTSPLTLPAAPGPGVDPSLAPTLLEHLATYHSEAVLLALLPGRVDVDAGTLPSLAAMIDADLASDALFQELRGDVDAVDIAGLIEALRPLGRLFEQSAVFDAEALEFIAANRDLFGIADFGSIDTDAARNVETYRVLQEPWLRRPEEAPDLLGVLGSFTTAARFAAADQTQLALVVGCDLGLLHALVANLALGTTAFDVLRDLTDAVAFADPINLGGAALTLAQSESFDDLTAASAAVQAALRTSYPEEDDWETRVEPLDDALLSRRRDGLVAYLVHSGLPHFDEVADLYHYFLLDVELEGCARTSRVASAIDSVQLYVHRCRTNLEETGPGDPAPVHVLPESIPADEWEWRQNYRVWEANRKIFLYPENFIEPELRDNKTPLFEQLEEELLAKEVTDEAILEAYARYLRGFDELAHLTIAGSYHEKDKAAKRDVLHLFGVTADEPPTYYYRRVENAHYGANNDDVATHWGPWEKVDAQITVRKVSPLVHRGQLYVFWNRYNTKPRNEIEEGSSTFAGYEHRGYVAFSKRRLDGSWTTPQDLRLGTDPFVSGVFPTWYRDNGVILDPIVTKADVLAGFDVRAEIFGLTVQYRADASGHAVVDLPFIGKQTIQLPLELLSATGSTTLSINEWRFDVTPVREPSLRAPLYDTSPHEESKDGYTLSGFGWDRIYPTSAEMISIRGFNYQMWSPVDLYRLEIGARYEFDNDPFDDGVPWLNPAITVLAIIIAAIADIELDLPVELIHDRLVWTSSSGDRRTFHASKTVLPCFDAYSFADILVHEERLVPYGNSMAIAPTVWSRPQWSDEVTDYLRSLQTGKSIGDAPSDATVDVVNGSYSDVVIQGAGGGLYLQSKVRDDGRYHLRRLSTSLSEDIADLLFNRGLDVLLATETQLGLGEHPTDFAPVAGEVADDTSTGEMDFDGAMGTYLREIFFHIPFLIANHLNSQGKFAEAQKWYQVIFDPTAAETIATPAGLTDEERERLELDRNWRYREFRGRDLDSLRSQLTNASAIEAYRRDPFNPHAVARLRISAYQKAIVMKYVDNLLDWGDDCFTRAFALKNPEYLREATLKYVTAQELLGDRPAELGDCGEGALSPKTFPNVKEAMGDQSEFFAELETIVATRYRRSSRSTTGSKRVGVGGQTGLRELARAYEKVESAKGHGGTTRAKASGPGIKITEAHKQAAANATYADAILAVDKHTTEKLTSASLYETLKYPDRAYWPKWGVSFTRQVSPVFCVPGNTRMLAHWDRVEDRLYKLRHCMDIDGVKRQLALFAPPIDPALLVGGRAGGLSLDDILAAGAGTLPPYRFRYLIDKAKGYAATVQAFGGALLGALEKRDGEELSRLRNTHQKNILAMTTEVKRNELKISAESLEIARRKLAAAQYRYDYYDGLMSAGLTPAEIVETTARITSTAASAVRLSLALAAGSAHLLPQVGSPFSMKYGGDEGGKSLTAFATAAGVTASFADMVATLAGIYSGFERREQGWEHQRTLAENDLATIEREVEVVTIRTQIAERSLELHEKAIEQHDEVIDFFRDKFSNLGLYTHLSRTLQQLHREAYNNAMVIARLAEQAYRFERPGDHTIFVGGEWDASRSGLLAGERLTMALQAMETRFIENNDRTAEINQSFSLTQVAPEALIDLREIGTCEFSLPEFYFDMFYPGQYRRRTRAVRLTIPCITGPYTNVSAKLTLLGSAIRRDPVLGDQGLSTVPLTGTTSVATSTAQGDGGVFEMSFRDERYMPFEGSGAISTWRLELPTEFRPFDYQSINDVILNLSYTAEEDGVLRADVESSNAALAGSLTEHLTNNALTRTFSLRQDFSDSFNRLVQAPAGSPVTFELNERHFPLFVQGRDLGAAAATMVLVIEDRAVPLGTAALSLNGLATAAFSPPTDPPAPGDPFGGLPTADITASFAAGVKQQHSIQVDDAGGLALPGGTPTLHPEQLRDVLIILEYQLA